MDSLLVIIGLSTVLYLASAMYFQAVGRTDDTHVSPGKDRAYKLSILVSYDSTRPSPLVINMNGTVIWPYRP